MSAEPIVVATDLSARSDRAVDRAIRLGLDTGRPVKVLHAVDRQTHDEDNIRLNALIRETLGDPEADVDVVVVAGSPPKAISEAAATANAALIVAGPARFNNLGDYFLGTAIDHLLRKSSIPVLVVKQRPHRAYRSILVPTDLSEPSAQALMAATRLFPDAKVTIVHAYHVPFEGLQRGALIERQSKEENERELESFLEKYSLPSTIVRELRYGETQKAIADAIEELNPDLVVLGTHGSGGFRFATIGSMANALLSQIDRDTLVVPARR